MARVRASLTEKENGALRARLASLETEYARFRDQALARLGVITAPVTEHTTTAVPASPIAGVLNALQVGGSNKSVTLDFAVPTEVLDVLSGFAAGQHRPEFGGGGVRK